MSSRHSRRRSFMPKGPLRWTLVAVGLWSLLVTAIETAPRYERVVALALAIIVITAGVTPAAYLLVASVLLALAGVVAAASIIEAVALAAGAIVAGVLSCFFTGPLRRTRHSAATT